MEQIREPVLQGRFQSLDEAAKETTTALARANIRHGFIGGYAVSLIGGTRMTSALSIVPLTANDQPERIRNTPIPIVAPSVLVLTKIKRWSTLAESTRPQSIKKADSDIDDIEVLLKWLARNQFHIDFEGYLAKPKEELLSGVRKLYQMHAAFRPLLETTLDEESFALINNWIALVFISAPIPSFHPPHGIFNSLLEIFFTLVIVTFTILRIQWLVA
ncbi:hypothetical protein KXV68_004740 [Aspergillus fumigatus]|nr:hypothetical protein CNMCM8812_004087 [Aspergillus fumigatus]KAH1712197.1 hypothetical protein KXX40_006187 [Aspergillus fumigatus]KAH1717824.1 hypothetical protein KXX25_003963 [Aspergillus fumigatus]KAH1775168.1 hypothetical protein KXX20_003823 [Aspergillus fumigatus]KAH1813362.1 hypothetical protein KXX35_005200 [Aspergillus fumigatus]